MVRRLCLDTNVYAQAHLEEDGPSSLLVGLAVSGAFKVIISERLLGEVSELFRRLYGREEAYRMRFAILAFPELHVIDPLQWERALPLITPFVRDQTDAPHLAAARAGVVDAFVTYNRRSVFPGIFDLVPLVTPDFVVAAVAGLAAWPTRDEILQSWKEWARVSSRSPKRKL